MENIYEYYKKILQNKDLSIPEKKGWELIKERNENRQNYIAMSEGKNKITYQEMFAKWDESAKVFSALGITAKNNSRVLVIMPNVAHTANINYGLNMTGAICDFIDPTTPVEKIKKYIEDEKITDIIGLDILLHKNIGQELKAIKEEYKIKNIIIYHSDYITSLLPLPVKLFSNLINFKHAFSKDFIRYQDAVNNTRYSKIEYDLNNDEAISLITHTSGTTNGIGKPIPLSDRNRNGLVIQHDLANIVYEPGMTMMHFIPYFAAYGAINTVHLGFSQGMELQEVPLFSPNKFGDLLLELKSNIVLANTPAWLGLLNNPKMQNVDLSFLSCAVSGGTPNTAESEIEFNKFLKDRGCAAILSKGYGLSEVCGCVSFEFDKYKRIGGMGVPLPLVDIKLRDTETAQIFEPTKDNNVGEIIISSPTMTCGSLDDKDVITTVDHNGKRYLVTKDVVKVNDDGSLEFIDRIDRMFPRYDAYKYYPQPVESLFKDTDEIKNCFISSYYDEFKIGNMPRVYIELYSEIDNKEEYIKRILDNYFLSNKNDAGYKANFRDIPSSWVFVEKIPTNTMGKNDYHKIKQEGIDGEEYYIDIKEDNMNISGYEIIKLEKSEKVKKLV